MSRRGSSWVITWFVLGICVPRTVEPSCESNIRLRAPTFQYNCNDTAPYTFKPLGEDAAADSMFREAQLTNYNNLAKALAISAQIYHCMQANQDISEQVAKESGGQLLLLWQEHGRDFYRSPRKSLREPAPPDSLVDRLRGCVHDSTTTLYTVQVGSFLHRVNAVARLQHLEDLRTKLPEGVADSTRTVDWWNDTCGGTKRPDLFILGPDEAPGPGYKILHGMFVERRDAIAARDRVRQRFPATVISVQVTGRILRAALEHR